MDIFKDALHFEWDRGNKHKNFLKHNVTGEEAEEIFFDPHKRIVKADLMVKEERRYLLIGKTKFGRSLFVVFTFRTNRVRIISARDLNRKEKKWYEEGR